MLTSEMLTGANIIFNLSFIHQDVSLSNNPL